MPRKRCIAAGWSTSRSSTRTGNLDAALAEGTLSDVEVKILYQKMIICREFDEAAFRLQRSGRMGTYPQNKGQEATALGAAKALKQGRRLHRPLLPR